MKVEVEKYKTLKVFKGKYLKVKRKHEGNYNFLEENMKTFIFHFRVLMDLHPHVLYYLYNLE